MSEYSDSQQPERDYSRQSASGAAVEPALSKMEQRELAHSRDRICKYRRCEVCAPLRERRHLKKVQRKADAQAELHAKGEPCSQLSCAVAACVESRDSPTEAPDPVAPEARKEHAQDLEGDLEQRLRGEAERHRVGLPCGSQDCPSKVCIDGFARERVRRHRAHRPCRSTTCSNPICVSGRSPS
jgi:hypothetical protein